VVVDGETNEVTVNVDPDDDAEISIEDGNIVITLPPDTDIDDIEVPNGWNSVETTDNDGNVIVTITPPAGYEVVEEEDGTLVLRPIDTRPERELHRAYMFGDTAGEFRPGATITRAEVAAILVRTELRDFEAFTPETRELPEGMASFNKFSDVLPHNWHFYYVAWAYDAGLVSGLPDGTFRPNQPITRQEIAAMLSRLDGVELRDAGTPAGIVDFGDTQNWARDYVYTVYSEGLMVGDARNQFRPRANITRAETATVFNRNLGRLDSVTAYNAAEVERDNKRDFPDVNVLNTAGTMTWFFPSVLGATNDHYLTRDDNGDITEKYVRYEQPWRD